MAVPGSGRRYLVNHHLMLKPKAITPQSFLIEFEDCCSHNASAFFWMLSGNGCGDCDCVGSAIASSSS